MFESSSGPNIHPKLSNSESHKTWNIFTECFQASHDDYSHSPSSTSLSWYVGMGASLACMTTLAIPVTANPCLTNSLSLCMISWVFMSHFAWIGLMVAVWCTAVWSQFSLSHIVDINYRSRYFTSKYPDALGEWLLHPLYMCVDGAHICWSMTSVSNLAEIKQRTKHK